MPSRTVHCMIYKCRESKQGQTYISTRVSTSHCLDATNRTRILVINLASPDRLSGLWGMQTPLGLWLQENEMTTLFFGGVNADQCVVSLPTTSGY